MEGSKPPKLKIYREVFYYIKEFTKHFRILYIILNINISSCFTQKFDRVISLYLIRMERVAVRLVM